jgi:hypothetical protein
MTEQASFSVVLFESVSHALLAEKIIKTEGISYKLIPVPRHISSDCGVCLRFNASDRERIEKLLAGRLDHFEIAAL